MKYTIRLLENNDWEDDDDYEDNEEVIIEPIINSDFHKWFGNSKVVDKNGKPLVVYHGTNYNFDTFKVGTKTKRFVLFSEFESTVKGVYVAENKEDAKEFGKNILPLYVKIENPFIPLHKQPDKFFHSNADGAMVKYRDKYWDDYLYIFSAAIEEYRGQRIIDLLDHSIFVEDDRTDEDDDWDEEKSWLNKISNSFDWAVFDHDEVINRIKERGYDGVMYINEPQLKSSFSHLCFYPNQVKSTNNKGSWSSNSHNIFESYEDDTDIPTASIKDIQSYKKELAFIAQKVYDDWDESDVDTYANGGICHLIADAIADYLNFHGIETVTVSSDHEQHVYCVSKVIEGIYTVDIHWSYYETGGGYNWKKIPNVVFDGSEIEFYKVSSDYNDWDEYIGDM